MDRYYIYHKDHTPEAVAEAWPNPRDLNGTYFVYRDCAQLDPDTPVSYEPVADAEGAMPDVSEVLPIVAGLMYGNAPLIVLHRAQCLNLLSTPQWRIYTGQYDTEQELVDDCTAVGITPAGADLAAKIESARTLLMLALA